MPEIRRLNKTEQEEAVQLIILGCKVSRVQDHMNTKTKKLTCRKDFYNYAAKEKNPNEHELDESLAFLKKQGL